MKNKRRDFLKMAGVAGISLTTLGTNQAFAKAGTTGTPSNGLDPTEGNPASDAISNKANHEADNVDRASGIINDNDNTNQVYDHPDQTTPGISIIGNYGPWAAGIMGDKIPSLSFRNKSYTSVDAWRPVAKKALQSKLGIPDAGGTPAVTLVKQYT